MDHITLGEKTLIKSSVLAKKLGYTSDYIGQLCRSQKVSAKLVGRTWYVDEESVREHKKGRYRSTREVAKKNFHAAVQKVAAKSESVGFSVPISKGLHHEEKFYTHRSTTLMTPQYVSDNAELLPSLRKPQKEPVSATIYPQSNYVSVELADAASLHVTAEKDNSKIKFEADELPDIKFKGKVAVFAAPEDEVAVPDKAQNQSEVVPEVDDTDVEPPHVVMNYELHTKHVHITPEKKSREPDSFDVDLSKSKHATIGESDREVLATDVAKPSVPDRHTSSASKYHNSYATSANTTEIVIDPHVFHRRTISLTVLGLTLFVALLLVSLEYRVTVDEILITRSYSIEMSAAVSEIRHIFSNISASR